MLCGSDIAKCFSLVTVTVMNDKAKNNNTCEERVNLAYTSHPQPITEKNHGRKISRNYRIA